jgi:hypothetical protein
MDIDIAELIRRAQEHDAYIPKECQILRRSETWHSGGVLVDTYLMGVLIKHEVVE